MPPKKRDRNGNPFQVGYVYELYGHILELLSMDGWTHGNFVIVKDVGALREGKMLKLQLNDDYKPLRPGNSTTKNNKAAAIFLEQEW